MIKDNEDLDLPSQRQLLARFKCDEIIPTIIEALDAKVDGISRIHEKGGMVVELGVTMKEIIREMHSWYSAYFPLSMAADYSVRIIRVQNVQILQRNMQREGKISRQHNA